MSHPFRRKINESQSRDTGMAMVLLLLVAIAVMWPHSISIAVAICCGWASVTLLIKAFRLRFLRKR
jgi:hypothetical protein